MELWILAALANPLIFSIVTLIDKRVLSGFGLGLPSFNLFVGGSQGLFGATVLLLNFPAGVEFEIIARAWSIGVLQAFSLIFMFWMLKREDPSRVIPAMQTSPIYVALLAWMIFGESLSVLHWLAVILAVSGSVLASIQVGSLSPNGKVGFQPVFLLLAAGALLMASSQLITKSIVDDLSTIHIVSLRGTGLFTVMWLVFARPTALKGLGSFLKQPKWAPWLIIAEGVMPFNGHLLITYAIGKGPIALVSALGGARPIFVFSMTAMSAWLAPNLIYEKFTRADMIVKLVSASMVVTAVAIISLV
ncbi:MAG: EamA family transporter [Dehalococcoidia bacterium]|nr:EamA family transporter [Dehalococcoidia bacterium]MDP7090144.1 EamA family transporter [Dehalococcoidia bacterium]MDP7262576.1 EamA family transporter [Dehalococcoidia bacterium]MDP7486140.1 EamA family transporter [Dehalococcoidia bacterium]